MVEVEDIKMRKPFEDGTYIIIEGRSIEGRPGLSAQLFIPPDKYEYLGMKPLMGRELSEEELEAFLDEILSAAKKAVERNRLELFLARKGFERM